MGTFGYICRGCGTPINGESLGGGEKCILIHIRHGKELGRAEGHYDGYGRVVEDKVYRNDGEHPNSHKEICKSEYELGDSFLRCQKVKIYKGKKVDFNTFCNLYLGDLTKKHNYCIENFEYKHLLSGRFLNGYRVDYMAYRKWLKLDKLNAQAIARELVRELTAEIVNSDLLRRAVEMEYMRLPKLLLGRYSGTIAWHSKCYRCASASSKNIMVPSHMDPNQSNDRIRKKYI